MTPIGVRLGFAAAAFCASATFAHAEVDHQKMARATLEQYNRPGPGLVFGHRPEEFGVGHSLAEEVESENKVMAGPWWTAG